MSRSLRLALCLVALGGGIASAAPAPATVNPLVALDEFNAIIYDNAATTSDIEGAAIVGGNFSGASVFTSSSALTPKNYADLTIFGSALTTVNKISNNDINLDNGGTAYIGRPATKNAEHINGKVIKTTPPATISAFQTAFDSFSAALDGLKSTSSLPTPGNSEVISVTPASDGVAVLDITSGQLESIGSYAYSFNLNKSKSLIINVDASATSYKVDFNGNYNNQGELSTGEDIIWNFYNATSVTLGTQIAGTILAPDANVTNNNAIDGTLVAASWTGSGELHNDLYAGGSPFSPSAAPEPTIWVLMLAGIGGLGLILRRGRKSLRPGCKDTLAA